MFPIPAPPDSRQKTPRLHAKLSSMLHGIEATPDTGPRDSTADAVDDDFAALGGAAGFTVIRV